MAASTATCLGCYSGVMDKVKASGSSSDGSSSLKQGWTSLWPVNCKQLPKAAVVVPIKDLSAKTGFLPTTAPSSKGEFFPFSSQI